MNEGVSMRYLNGTVGSNLVGCRIFAKAGVSVDAEDYVLGGQLGYRLIDVDDSFGRSHHERLPVFQSAPVLRIMRCVVISIRSVFRMSRTYTSAMACDCSP